MEVPHFNLKLDPDNFNESIKPILKQVRPEWNMDEVHFETFTEGISNKLAGCSPPGRGRSSDTILFRLYGNKTELFIDRQAELETFKIFRSHGFGPAVEGTFENGLCYGFLEGPVIDCDNIQDLHVSEVIARHMARSHAIKLPANSRHKSEASLFPTLKKFIKLFPGHFTQPEKQSRWAKLITFWLVLVLHLSSVGIWGLCKHQEQFPHLLAWGIIFSKPHNVPSAWGTAALQALNINANAYLFKILGNCDEHCYELICLFISTRHLCDKNTFLQSLFWSTNLLWDEKHSCSQSPLPFHIGHIVKYISSHSIDFSKFNQSGKL